MRTLANYSRQLLIAHLADLAAEQERLFEEHQISFPLAAGRLRRSQPCTDKPGTRCEDGRNWLEATLGALAGGLPVGLPAWAPELAVRAEGDADTGLELACLVQKRVILKGLARLVKDPETLADISIELDKALLWSFVFPKGPDCSKYCSKVHALEALESAARSSEARFRGLIEASPDATILVGEGGLIEYVNSRTEKLFGYERQELLGRPVEILIPERYRALHSFERARFREDPKTRPMEGDLGIVGLRKDASEFPADISLSPLDLDQGSMVIASIRDMTKRQAEEIERITALRQADVLKDQFLSILSHELRTPINAITGFGSMLQDGLAGELSQQQQWYLEKIQTAADALLSLVDDLLEVSRITAGKFVLQPRPMRFEEVCDHAIEMMTPQSAQRGQNLHVSIARDLPIIEADEDRIAQVLRNLLGNAIKFTPNGGELALRAWQEDGSLVCEVEDSGIGIAQTDRPKLFKPFSQIDMSMTRKVGGTGLGLFICKTIIEAHGGQIDVRSRVDQGSIFWFRLPIARETNQATLP